MNTAPRFALLACLAIAPALAACTANSPPASAPDTTVAAEQPRTALGRTVARALDEARQKMATENVSVSGDMDIQVGSARVNRSKPRDAAGNPLPRAEISPQGDLLVDGTAVAVTPAQRQMLLDYRGHILDVAGVGMTLGAKGADLGMQAAGGAIKGIFTGQMDEFEKRIEAEAAVIEAEALKLCDRLPALLASQQALAASLPEFRPYATMTQDDIDDCGKETGTRTAQKQAVRDTIREEIRTGIRSATGAAANREPPGQVDSENLSAAEEAEAAGR